MIPDDKYQNIVNKFNIRIDTLREDIRFYMVALNLSGKREDLEKEAFDLIEKKGAIKALEKRCQKE